MIFLQLLAGFALLVAGGEALVRGAVSVAARAGLSPLLIGLTLVGFGTSTPELVTSVRAAMQGLPGIAVGNVVGSNIANILLILGVAAVIYPISVARRTLLRDGIALLVSTALCIAVVLTGVLSGGLGLLLIGALLVYLAIAYLSDRASDGGAAHHALPESGPVMATPAGKPLLMLGLAVVGIAVTILGAGLAVDAAVQIALLSGLSQTVVGLTIVAVGTSLPELVTSVMAALRRAPGIALGNVVGSNIFNILGILGVTAVMKPLVVPPQIAVLDIWVMTAATAALILAVGLRERIGRAAGLIFVTSYVAYTVWLVAMA